LIRVVNWPWKTNRISPLREVLVDAAEGGPAVQTLREVTQQVARQAPRRPGAAKRKTTNPNPPTLKPQPGSITPIATETTKVSSSGPRSFILRGAMLRSAASFRAFR